LEVMTPNYDTVQCKRFWFRRFIYVKDMYILDKILFPCAQCLSNVCMKPIYYVYSSTYALEMVSFV